MRTTTQALAKTLTISALVCILLTPCAAQKAGGAKAVQKNDEAFPLIAEGQALLARVRALPHPATRAFLYPQVAALLWERVGANDDLRWVALDATATSIEDIYKNQQQIPRASISFFYADLIGTVRRYDAAEAKRLERSFPIEAASAATEQEKAGASFQSALAGYEKGTKQAESLSDALGLIDAGGVPPAVLLGAVLWLDQAKSPALSRVLSAVLSLEERQAGSLPFTTISFLSQVYLNDSAPLELRKRFLAVVIASASVRSEELRNDPQAFMAATQLLKRSLPLMQTLTPSLYPRATSLLASLAPNLLQMDTAWDRIKASAEPFEQTLLEADRASDPRLKRELLESAARLAHQRGDLLRAVDLMTAEEEDRGGLPKGYSYRDEFLDQVVQDALRAKDLEAANYAASKMNLPPYRVEALRKIAQRHVESGDITLAASTLNEATKALRDGPDGLWKIGAYLRLSSDFLRIDKPRASEMIRAAAKAADAIKRPDKDERGEFAQTLYPLLNETVRTFRLLARDDRAGALSAAGSFDAKEFGVAAVIGVNSAPNK